MIKELFNILFDIDLKALYSCTFYYIVRRTFRVLAVLSAQEECTLYRTTTDEYDEEETKIFKIEPETIYAISMINRDSVGDNPEIHLSNGILSVNRIDLGPMFLVPYSQFEYPIAPEFGITYLISIKEVNEFLNIFPQSKGVFSKTMVSLYHCLSTYLATTTQLPNNSEASVYDNVCSVINTDGFYYNTVLSLCPSNVATMCLTTTLSDTRPCLIIDSTKYQDINIIYTGQDYIRFFNESYLRDRMVLFDEINIDNLDLDNVITIPVDFRFFNLAGFLSDNYNEQTMQNLNATYITDNLLATLLRLYGKIRAFKLLNSYDHEYVFITEKGHLFITSYDFNYLLDKQVW